MSLKVTGVRKKISSSGKLLSKFRLLPMSIKFSFVVLVVITLIAITGNLLAPYDPTEVDFFGAYGVPNLRHLLGQDEAGRDVLSRLVSATRLSVLGPLLVVIVSTLVGVPLGLLTGYLGGWSDSFISRIFDIIFAFPALLLAIAIVAIFGMGFITCVIAVAITYIPLMARTVRSGTLSEKGKDYVTAIKLQGLPSRKIAVGHIFPTLLPLIVSQMGVFFSYSLLDLAALSFLGLGVQPPNTDWGGMLANAGLAIFHSPFNVVPPALCLVILVVCSNLLADHAGNQWSLKR